MVGYSALSKTRATWFRATRVRTGDKTATAFQMPSRTEYKTSGRSSVFAALARGRYFGLAIESARHHPTRLGVMRHCGITGGDGVAGGRGHELLKMLKIELWDADEWRILH